ncbi:MAG: carboxypeptidase-like regulatory domain-containing protein [Flavobacterium sp.]
MNQILIGLFIICGLNAAIAQSVIRGTVKEKSGEAVSHVTVSTEDGRHVTLTNDAGSFTLTYPAGTKMIVLEHIGYTPLFISVNEFQKDGIIYIQPEDLILDEVIVMNTSMREHIEGLVKSSIAQMQSPLQLSTYYREFINMNKKYIKFADGLIDYNLDRNKEHIDTDLIVNQSRAVSFPESEEEAAIRVIPADVRNAVGIACNFGIIEHIFDGKKRYKKYEFLIKSQKAKSGQVTETIFFKPKEGVEEALFEGTIVYDPAKKRILNIDATMAAPLRKYAKIRNLIIGKARLESFTYQSAFKVVDGQYMLSHSALFGNMHVWNNSGSINNVYRVKSDMIVTNFTSNFADFSRKEKFKHRTLYERGTNYKDKFWLTNNSIQLTAEEEAIVKEIEAGSDIKTN